MSSCGTVLMLGPCYKLHDEKLRRDYVESDKRGKVGYEADFLAYLERIIRDLDRKISRGQDRLRRSAEAKQQVSMRYPLSTILAALKGQLSIFPPIVYIVHVLYIAVGIHCSSWRGRND